MGLGDKDKDWWKNDNIKPCDLLEHQESWSLAADCATFKVLHNISQKLLSKSDSVASSLSVITDNVDNLSLGISNTTNSFLLHGSTKFIENKITEDSGNVQLVSEQKNDEKANRSDDALFYFKEALKNGIEFANKAYLKHDIVDSDSEGEGTASALPLYMMLNSYDDAVPLPYIIGTKEFMEDDRVGLTGKAFIIESDKAYSTSDFSDIEENAYYSAAVSKKDKVENRSVTEHLPSLDSNLCDMQNHIQDDLFGLEKSKDSFIPTPIFNPQLSESKKIYSDAQNVKSKVCSNYKQYGSMFTEPPPLPSDPTSAVTTNASTGKENDLESGDSMSGLRRGLFDSDDDENDILFGSSLVSAKIATNSSISNSSKNYRSANSFNGHNEDKDNIFKSGCSASDTSNANGSDIHVDAIEDKKSFSKAPVGGINIFNSAITAAIQKHSSHSTTKEENHLSGPVNNLPDGELKSPIENGNKYHSSDAFQKPASSEIISSSLSETSNNLSIVSENINRNAVEPLSSAKTLAKVILSDSDDELFVPKASKTDSTMSTKSLSDMQTNLSSSQVESNSVFSSVTSRIKPKTNLKQSRSSLFDSSGDEEDLFANQTCKRNERGSAVSVSKVHSLSASKNILPNTSVLSSQAQKLTASFNNEKTVIYNENVNKLEENSEKSKEESVHFKPSPESLGTNDKTLNSLRKGVNIFSDDEDDDLFTSETNKFSFFNSDLHDNKKCLYKKTDFYDSVNSVGVFPTSTLLAGSYDHSSENETSIFENKENRYDLINRNSEISGCKETGVFVGDEISSHLENNAIVVNGTHDFNKCENLKTDLNCKEQVSSKNDSSFECQKSYSEAGHVSSNNAHVDKLNTITSKDNENQTCLQSNKTNANDKEQFETLNKAFNSDDRNEDIFKSEESDDELFYNKLYKNKIGNMQINNEINNSAANSEPIGDLYSNKSSFRKSLSPDHVETSKFSTEEKCHFKDLTFPSYKPTKVEPDSFSTNNETMADPQFGLSNSFLGSEKSIIEGRDDMHDEETEKLPKKICSEDDNIKQNVFLGNFSNQPEQHMDNKASSVLECSNEVSSDSFYDIKQSKINCAFLDEKITSNDECTTTSTYSSVKDETSCTWKKIQNKRPPVGGIALFGGNELLAKIQDRKNKLNEEVEKNNNLEQGIDKEERLAALPSNITTVSSHMQAVKSEHMDEEESTNNLEQGVGKEKKLPLLPSNILAISSLMQDRKSILMDEEERNKNLEQGVDKKKELAALPSKTVVISSYVDDRKSELMDEEEKSNDLKRRVDIEKKLSSLTSNVVTISSHVEDRKRELIHEEEKNIDLEQGVNKENKLVALPSNGVAISSYVQQAIQVSTDVKFGSLEKENFKEKTLKSGSIGDICNKIDIPLVVAEKNLKEALHDPKCQRKLENKKPPIGGVALFGGNELLAKIKERRSKINDKETNDDQGNNQMDTNVSRDLQTFSNECNDQNLKWLTMPSDDYISSSYLLKISAQEAGASFDVPVKAASLHCINKSRPKLLKRKLPNHIIRRSHSKELDSESVVVKKETFDVKPDILLTKEPLMKHSSLSTLSSGSEKIDNYNVEDKSDLMHYDNSSNLAKINDSSIVDSKKVKPNFNTQNLTTLSDVLSCKFYEADEENLFNEKLKKSSVSEDDKLSSGICRNKLNQQSFTENTLSTNTGSNIVKDSIDDSLAKSVVSEQVDKGMVNTNIKTSSNQNNELSDDFYSDRETDNAYCKKRFTTNKNSSLFEDNSDSDGDDIFGTTIKSISFGKTSLKEKDFKAKSEDHRKNKEGTIIEVGSNKTVSGDTDPLLGLKL